MTVFAKTSAVSRMVALTLLLSVGATFQSGSLSALHNEGIWSHLRVGTWILENKSWPHTGLFSQAANLPWRDFSWAYDVLAALKFREFNLRSVPALLMSFRFALAALTFVLAGGLRGNFWSAVALSAVAQYILGAMGPGPACVSVIFFGIALLLLLEFRKTGNLRLLYALPPLFLLWTNADVGFVHGIGLYALFLVALSIEQSSWFEAPKAGIPMRSAWLFGGACVLASMVTPYGYHGYAAFFAEQVSAANEYLPPYKAMSFHQPQDYALLLLVMLAFLALGLRRTKEFFRPAVLSEGVILAFHSQRDSWLAVLPAAAIIGQAIVASSKTSDPARSHWKRHTLPAVGLAAALVFLAFLRLPDREQLLAKVSETLPLGATEYITKNHLPTPFFNTYRWGSFLTCYLPGYPVAIDARRGLYPEEQETDYFKIMKVEMPYQSFQPMRQARTLLLDKTDVLGDALRELPGFQVAYEDRISIVLLQEQKE